MKKLDIIIKIGEKTLYTNAIRMTFIPQINMFYIIPANWYYINTYFASNLTTFVSIFNCFWSNYLMSLKGAKTALQKYYEETKIGKKLIDSWIKTITKMEEKYETNVKNTNNTITKSV